MWTSLRRNLPHAVRRLWGHGRPDTATRMAMEADFKQRPESAIGAPQARTPEVDPIDELLRIVGPERVPPRDPRIAARTWRVGTRRNTRTRLLAREPRA